MGCTMGGGHLKGRLKGHFKGRLKGHLKRQLQGAPQGVGLGGSLPENGRKIERKKKTRQCPDKFSNFRQILTNLGPLDWNPAKQSSGHGQIWGSGRF